MAGVKGERDGERENERNNLWQGTGEERGIFRSLPRARMSWIYPPRVLNYVISNTFAEVFPLAGAQHEKSELTLRIFSKQPANTIKCRNFLSSQN